MKKIVSLALALGLLSTLFTGQVFAADPDSSDIATFYQKADYQGYQVSLSEGTYTTKQLKEKGIRDNDISSLKVSNGYFVTLYRNNNFKGTHYAFDSDVSNLAAQKCDNAISSLKIERAYAQKSLVGQVTDLDSTYDLDGNKHNIIEITIGKFSIDYELATESDVDVLNKFVVYAINTDGFLTIQEVLGENTVGFVVNQAEVFTQYEKDIYGCVLLEKDGVKTEYRLAQRTELDLINKFILYSVDEDGLQIRAVLDLKVNKSGRLSAKEVLDTNKLVRSASGTIKATPVTDPITGERSIRMSKTYKVRADASIVKVTTEKGSITSTEVSDFDSLTAQNKVIAFLDKEGSIFAIFYVQ